MKIIMINTQNKLVARNMLIKAAIKSGMQYVEMEDEVLIAGDYLIKINEKEHFRTSFDLLSLEKGYKDFKSYIDLDSNLELQTCSIPKYTKFDYKKQSKIVNKKLKMKHRYNYRRR